MQGLGCIKEIDKSIPGLKNNDGLTMAKTEPFEKFPHRYEQWFEENNYLYESELKAVKELLPKGEKGLEIGVGSSRFAAPLGIKVGIDPSAKMRRIAQSRGIQAFDGVAESLPFKDSEFDFALMVTTVCFLDDIDTAFAEAFRVIKPGGYFVIGFIDKDSPIGKIYQIHKDENPFYRVADFYSVNEVTKHLKQAGFYNFCHRQTVFRKLSEVKKVEPVKEGYGEGSFVVIRAKRLDEF